MKKLFIIIIVALFSATINAQSVKQDASGNYIAVSSNRVPNKVDSSINKTYTDGKGKVYPVYSTSKGKLYVIKTSAKTSKQYKQYLKL